MQSVHAQIKKALKSAKTALVVAHVDPDGDTIGSMLAMAMILRKMGIRTDFYAEDGSPKTYNFLPHIAELLTCPADLGANYDLAVSVDAAALNRIGKHVNLKKIAKKSINIDHHPDNTHYADINYVEKASSAAELVYRLCRYLKIKLDHDIALCLYVALVTDTGNFRYENTTQFTFGMAAQLLDYGVRPSMITSRVYDTRSIAAVRILAETLLKMRFAANNQIVWSIITNEMMEKTNAKSEDLMGIVDQLRSLKDVEIAILMRESEGKVKVNFRSKEKVNVQRIARDLGGGGHIRAAGTVILGTVREVEKKVVETAVKYLKAQEYLV